MKHVSREILIKHQLELDVQEGIGEVLSGTTGMYIHKYLNPKMIIDYLQTMDSQADVEDSDTNGWEPDCWYIVTFRGVMYEIQTSGYAGGIRFYKKE